MLWGDAGLFAIFASGRLGWLLLGCFSGPVEMVFCSPGRHFESFVLPWGEPKAPGAPPRQPLEKIVNRLLELNWETFRTHFGQFVVPGAQF